MHIDRTTLVKLLESLNEDQRKELDRRVRVAVYLQNQTAHKCKPTHYCSQHNEYFCGECYTNHYRIKHTSASYTALEKFQTSPLVFWNKPDISSKIPAPKNSAQTKEKTR